MAACSRARGRLSSRHFPEDYPLILQDYLQGFFLLRSAFAEMVEIDKCGEGTDMRGTGGVGELYPYPMFLPGPVRDRWV